MRLSKGILHVCHENFRNFSYCEISFHHQNMFYSCKFSFASHFRPILSTENFLVCHWATVCKNSSPYAISPLSCPVCPLFDVGVLWPNGWTDQDETWYAGRPRPWPHCVRWGPSSPSPKGARPPNFRPISIAVKWLHGSRCHLVWR